MTRSVRAGNRGGVFALLVFLGGCGAAPTEPSLPRPLTPGAFMLSVLAPDGVFVGDQLVSACPGAGQGGYGSIVTHARVETDGEWSRVRPASASDGAFELLLMRDASLVQSGLAVAGSIRGVVVNTIAPSPLDGTTAADARATFSGLHRPGPHELRAPSTVAVLSPMV